MMMSNKNQRINAGKATITPKPAENLPIDPEDPIIEEPDPEVIPDPYEELLETPPYEEPEPGEGP